MPSTPGGMTSMFLPQAESTSLSAGGDDSESASASISFSASPAKNGGGVGAGEGEEGKPNAPGSAQTALAHIAQVRALILGM